MAVRVAAEEPRQPPADGVGVYRPRRSLWLDATLLAPVPHRQVVLTLPKRLRAYCLYRRSLLGDLARVAARVVTLARRLTRPGMEPPSQ